MATVMAERKQEALAHHSSLASVVSMKTEVHAHARRSRVVVDTIPQQLRDALAEDSRRAARYAKLLQQLQAVR